MAVSEVTDGPVLSVINKRIRALRKKYNRILQMEESIAQGKPILKEQEDFFRSKPAICALTDELEKLRQPLQIALEEEINSVLHSDNAPVPPTSSERHPSEFSRVSTEDDDDVEKEEKGVENCNRQMDVEDLLNVLYFGNLFDVKPQSEYTSSVLTRTHERGCCLTYDYVTDEATDLLGEGDLDLISKLGSLLISRPMDSTLSHMNALERCMEHAKLWLSKSDQPIVPEISVTYASLRNRLSKIMASDYFTTTPEMKAPDEMTAAVVAKRSYSYFQVPVHASSNESLVLLEDAEVVDEQHGHKDEQTEETNDEYMNGEQSAVEETEKDDTGSAEEQKPRRGGDGDHHHHHQQQQYYRGGAGRGGRRGSYQNGRGMPPQYYEQGGTSNYNYYPRNYYGRGRGATRPAQQNGYYRSGGTRPRPHADST